MAQSTNSKNITSSVFNAAGFATLIGSLPVKSHNEALELIFKHTPEIPLWPQLPSNASEGMLSQFVEGFPGLVEDENKIFFNIHTDTFEAEHLAFFEQYLAASENPETLLDSCFATSKSRATGIYLLEEKVAGKNNVKAVKGQITGPFTLLTGLKDENKRDAYYDSTIRELAVKGIAMRAAWQVRFLKKTGVPAIVFIDEPALAGLGSSSYISISPDDIRRDLSEVIDAIQQAGGIAGIHVCANTDWDFLLSLDLDILSFDAYGFFDRLVVCKDKLHAFLDQGGIIAWGIVPTSEKEHIMGETPESLTHRWEDHAAMLTTPKWDLPALLKQSLITPSCGTGSLSPELALRVLSLTQEVSASLRKKYFDAA